MEKYKTIIGDWIRGRNVDYGEEDELYYSEHRNTIVKRSFYIEKTNEAILNIGCLGYYIVYINGIRVGNDELNNDWTNYKKCVYYETYNVSHYLQVGENNIAIELGNGMYNPSPLKLFGKYNLRENLSEIGEPQVICDLWIDNNLVLSSDKNWKYSLGNILFNNLYLGETIDFTQEETELSPVITEKNSKNLVPSFIPKIKKYECVEPKIINEYKNGLFVDFGEMISGFIKIDVIAKNKQKIILQYSERFEENEFDFTTVLAGSVGEQIKERIVYGGKGCPKYAIQEDKIICKDGENHFENKFAYHSFRYVYIQGCNRKDIIKIKGIYVHSDLKQIGYVKTDNDYLNIYYDAAIRTKLNNAHSTFEDCARERLGYGGDMVALATSNLYTFDLENFYKKIILDFRFDQTKNGGIPETAPYMGIQSNGTGEGEGPLLWQLVYPYLIYKRYQYYGDSLLVEQEYCYLEKHINYLMNYDVDDLATHCLGDHGSILIAGEFRKPTPDKLLLGYCTILLLLKYNILLGNIINKDTKIYQKRYAEIKKIIIEKFKNDDGSFGEGTQSGYAFAITLLLDDPKELCSKFVNKIKKDRYILNSGIFGMALTYEVLNKYGYDEIIEKWLLQDSSVGLNSMLSNGNKALAELFVGKHLSLNHAMFASYQQWYYQGLAGVKICEDAVGFNKIMLEPYFSKIVNKVECKIKTKSGVIISNWSRSKTVITWEISIPQYVKSEIILPQNLKIRKIEDKVGKIVYELENK